MKKLKYLMLAAALAVSFQGFGQLWYTNLSYDMSVPMGNTKDFISKTSFRGMSLNVGRYVTDNLDLNIRFSWHTFYEDMPYDSYTEGSRTVTGKQYRYINSFPMTVGSRYHFNPDSPFSPFVGIGLGAYSQELRTDMGIYYVDNDSQWKFGFYPELGLNWNFSYGTGVYFTARYDNTLSAGDTDGQSYLTFSIGFKFGH